MGRPAFADWVKDVYLKRYPPAPRDHAWRPPQDLGPWKHVAWVEYDHQVVMTAEQLGSYLLSQSNLQVVMEAEDESEGELRRWLNDETTQFFDDNRATAFVFGGFVACHQRAPVA